jgi:hypothetical protein
MRHASFAVGLSVSALVYIARECKASGIAAYFDIVMTVAGAGCPAKTLS